METYLGLLTYQTTKYFFENDLALARMSPLMVRGVVESCQSIRFSQFTAPADINK